VKESDMRKPLSAVAITVGFSLLLLSPAIARPVTSADLSGKKICWNTGDVENYYAGGKYSSPSWGDGTWVVTAAGVEIKSTVWSWASGAIANSW
jgi:hypothetical protein